MREFKEERVYITMEIPVRNKEIIEQIIRNKNISFNECINRAIKNNFKSSLTKINIYKREEGEPTKLRIYKSVYLPISNFAKKYDISITKIINHCIYEEVKKYSKVKVN